MNNSGNNNSSSSNNNQEMMHFGQETNNIQTHSSINNQKLTRLYDAYDSLHEKLRGRQDFHKYGHLLFQSHDNLKKFYKAIVQYEGYIMRLVNNFDILIQSLLKTRNGVNHILTTLEGRWNETKKERENDSFYHIKEYDFQINKDILREIMNDLDYKIKLIERYTNISLVGDHKKIIAATTPTHTAAATRPAEEGEEQEENSDDDNNTTTINDEIISNSSSSDGSSNSKSSSSCSSSSSNQNVASPCTLETELEEEEEIEEELKEEKTEISNVKQRLDSLERRNSTLQREIRHLRAVCEDMTFRNRRNNFNVMIYEMDESKNENENISTIQQKNQRNLKTATYITKTERKVIKEINKYLKIDMSMHDLQTAYRIQDEDVQQPSCAGFARPILVKLKCVKMKQLILDKYNELYNKEGRPTTRKTCSFYITDDYSDGERHARCMLKTYAINHKLTIEKLDHNMMHCSGGQSYVYDPIKKKVIHRNINNNNNNNNNRTGRCIMIEK